MAKIIRPLRFDAPRRDRLRERRNKTRRDRERRKSQERKRLMTAVNSIFWFGVEPETMWLAGDQPTNDN